MIRVTVYVNGNNQYTGFDCSGHAGYYEDGRDIVCAAVSMLTINTINAIEHFTQDKIRYHSDDQEGVLVFRIEEGFSLEAQLLLKTMLLGLESIEAEEAYQKYIDVIFEEVS